MQGLYSSISSVMNVIFMFFYNLVEPFFGSEGLTTALTIIVFVIVVKVCLIPLNIKMIASSVKMGRLSPKVEKINKRFANNPEKKNQEMMALYSEYGVNPMGGCLPMLVQMPILGAMFFTLQPQNTVLQPILDKSFLFIDNFLEPKNIILALLAGLTSFLQTYISQKQNGTAQPEGTAKTMMFMMPLMMCFFGYTVNSAVSLYYVISNVFQVVFMVVIRNIIIKKEEIKDIQREEDRVKNPKVKVTPKKRKVAVKGNKENSKLEESTKATTLKTKKKPVSSKKKDSDDKVVRKPKVKGDNTKAPGNKKPTVK